jgi:hypothetical protein
VIRLRSILERGRAHPVLGPILLVLLVLLLAFVFLHIVQEGVENATELGAMCVAIATVLGLLVSARTSVRRQPELMKTSDDRGPPRGRRLCLPTPAWAPPLAASTPLRR